MSAHIHQLTETIRLPRWQRLAIYGVTVWLFASGVTWLIARYTLRTAGEFGETIHPLEPWMLRVHGMAVLLGLFMYGTLLRAHMLKAWHLRKNRISGALASLVMIMLMASGYPFDKIDTHGTIDESSFIIKPYRVAQIAAKMQTLKSGRA